jgi:hypothetical protein
MTQIDPTFGMQHDREAVARATGLRVQDFDPSCPSRPYRRDVAYTVTPLKSLAVIGICAVDLESRRRVSGQDRGQVFLFRLP